MFCRRVILFLRNELLSWVCFFLLIQCHEIQLFFTVLFFCPVLYRRNKRFGIGSFIVLTEFISFQLHFSTNKFFTSLKVVFKHCRHILACVKYFTSTTYRSVVVEVWEIPVLSSSGLTGQKLLTFLSAVTVFLGLPLFMWIKWGGGTNKT